MLFVAGQCCNWIVMETTNRGMPFVVQWWHHLKFGGRSEERGDGPHLRFCNVKMDIVISMQIIWELYKVCGRLKKFVLVQNTKMWPNGKL